MKPNKIGQVLDLALEARKQNQVFNPMFVGEAGLGKSAIVQQWVEKQRKRNPKFIFLDLRIAYMEAPDLIGFPEVSEEGGMRRTCHRLPEFWPTNEDAEGLILFEEPNRGTTGVMNCLMQILTDRKLHNYTVPKGIIMGACINPDSSEYDVNHMDAALRNRFEEFEVDYDAPVFMDYIEKMNYHPNIQRFITSGIWIYKTTKEIGDGGKYISPRTWSKVHAAYEAGVFETQSLHRLVTYSILGKDIGNEFHKFCFDQAPVMAEDLIKNLPKALERLKQQSDPLDYKGDMISATIDSIVKDFIRVEKDAKTGKDKTVGTITEDVMIQVASIIPADQAVNLVKQCAFMDKKNVATFFKSIGTKYPELIKILGAAIKLDKAMSVTKDKTK